ncbi:30234_t:CDS:2, partial [Gigaspora margarita]
MTYKSRKVVFKKASAGTSNANKHNTNKTLKRNLRSCTCDSCKAHMDKQKTLAKNNANQIVQESIPTGLSFDLMQLDMSDSEPNNEPDNKIDQGICLNFLLAKNPKDKVTQNADNSDNEDNWEDINNDKTSEYGTDDDLTDEFISFDAPNGGSYNNNSDEP